MKNAAERNRFARALADLRARMKEGGYTVLTRDLELLAEVSVALEIKKPKGGRE